jgi:hypothetical protein
LWRDGNTFAVVTECAAAKPGAEKPPAVCRNFLDASERAQLQWKLEADFNRFESQRWPIPAKERQLASEKATTR